MSWWTWLQYWDDDEDSVVVGASHRLYRWSFEFFDETRIYSAQELSDLFTLNAESGSYGISGFAAALLGHRVIGASPGSYAVTGLDALTLAKRIIDAGSGEYSVTGAAADTLAKRLLNGDPGSYAVSGSAVATLVHRVFGLEPGSYTVIGYPTSFGTGEDLSSDALTGISGLAWGRNQSGQTIVIIVR